MKFKTYIEIEIEVSADYIAGCKGAREPGGLQIEPDDPGECNVTSVTVGGIDIMEALTPEQLSTLTDEAWEQPQEEDTREYERD